MLSRLLTTVPGTGPTPFGDAARLSAIPGTTDRRRQSPPSVLGVRAMARQMLSEMGRRGRCRGKLAFATCKNSLRIVCFVKSVRSSAREYQGLGVHAMKALNRLEPPGVRHVEPAVLRLPLVEGPARYPVSAAKIRRRSAGLMLAQNADDLLFAESRTLHRPSPPGDGPYLCLEEILGLRSPQAARADTGEVARTRRLRANSKSGRPLGRALSRPCEGSCPARR